MSSVSAFFKGKVTKKPAADGPKAWLEAPNVDARLGNFPWKALVATPPGVPEGEWIASFSMCTAKCYCCKHCALFQVVKRGRVPFNMLMRGHLPLNPLSAAGQFYRNLSVIYASLADFCTNPNCSAMTAGKYVVCACMHGGGRETCFSVPAHPFETNTYSTSRLHPSIWQYRTEFTWTDDKGKKLKNLSAPQYIDYCFSHIQSALDDEAVFPTRVGTFRAVLARC